MGIGLLELTLILLLLLVVTPLLGRVARAVLEARERVRQPEVRVTPEDPWSLFLRLIRPGMRAWHLWTLTVVAACALSPIPLLRVIEAAPDLWPLLSAVHLIAAGCLILHSGVLSLWLWGAAIRTVGVLALAMAFTGLLVMFGVAYLDFVDRAGGRMFLLLAVVICLVPPIRLHPRRPQGQRRWLQLGKE